MTKKGKHRREARRQRQQQSDAPVAPAGETGTAPSQDIEAAPERRARQIREWEERKKHKQRKRTPASVYAWIGGGVAATAAVLVGVVLLLSGGSGSADTPAVTTTPDPRVAGLPVAQTVEVDADDQGQATNPTFDPATISGRAGEVIEFKVVNVGSVAHNLRVSGEDKQYDTRDDFLTEPGTIQPGEEGIVRVKIDEPGNYPFRCDFHPVQQVGTLVLN